VQQSETISILCVDDEPSFLDAFTQKLRQEQGFSVTSVSTADEALERINARYFDVIISDYAMPDMDGLSMLQEIRARGCRSLFIVVTAKRLAHIAIDALNYGADYYFQKGADSAQEIAKLVGFIRKNVQERRAEREIAEWERFYQSVIENQTDLVCRISAEGTFRYANEAGLHFFRKSYEDLLADNFFSSIPDSERSLVLLRLQGISAIKPDLLLEHRIGSGEGKAVPLLWCYRGFFTAQGAVTEYQVSGRDATSAVRIGSPEPIKPSAPAAGPEITPEAPPVPEETDWKGLVETIQSLDNPVFAVDKGGVIIAWNTGLEELTGGSLHPRWWARETRNMRSPSTGSRYRCSSTRSSSSRENPGPWYPGESRRSGTPISAMWKRSA
jgi:CheY-like chemotaxis protein